MEVIQRVLTDAFILKPRLIPDERGFFFESYNEKAFLKATGIQPHFVQDNHSRSTRGVLRGLHYQVNAPQGKLVRVGSGSVYDVAVDLRRSSPTFGQHFSVELSGDNLLQFWIPEGFAHGFLVLSETADFLYKVTNFYRASDDRTVAWNDPQLDIPWPSDFDLKLSSKDLAGTFFREAEVYA